MMQRLLLWAVRSYIGAGSNAWIYTSAAQLGLRMVRSVRGRRWVVERLSIAPGQIVMIDHLRISHKQQMKDIKREKKQSKRAARKLAKQ